jgi:hypothetical protein
MPLPEQRLRRDDQDAPPTFREQLCDHQPGLDRLPEADLVREDAAALADPFEREDHGVNLVRVRIDPPAAL